MTSSEQHQRFFLNADMDHIETLAAGPGVATVYSQRCPHKTTSNEDAAGVVFVDKKRAVLIVADGLGGFREGDRASRLAVQQVGRAIAETSSNGGSLRVGIVNGFERANEAIQGLGTGAATTLAVVELDNSIARPYHVGDSLILLIGGHGKIKYQSLAHSPVGYLVESGHLSEAEAMHHEERHLVSNIVGEASMRIEIGPSLQLAPRDTLLVASDGLADNLHLDEIVEQIKCRPIHQAIQGLVENATDRMVSPSEEMPSKPDDLTTILYRPTR